MEYGGRVTLKQHITDLKLQSTRLYESQVKTLFKQLLSAMDYLHSINIVHLDLKLENILFVNKEDIKLIDFGFSRENRVD